MSMGRRSAAPAHGTAKASLPVHPRIPPVKSPDPPFRAWPCWYCGRWRHPPNPPVSPCSTPGQAPVHPRTPARTRKIPPPRPASRARPPPPPPRIRTRSVSTRQGRVRKMIPVSVCGPCGPEVLAALPLIQHRCDKVNTLVRDPAGFFCHFRDSRPAISTSNGGGYRFSRGGPQAGAGSFGLSGRREGAGELVDVGGFIGSVVGGGLARPDTGETGFFQGAPRSGVVGQHRHDYRGGVRAAFP